MPIKTNDGKWKCKICNMEFSRELYAYSCELGHDIIYIALSRSDLQRLMQFIVTKNDAILSESLMKTLKKYQRSTGA